MAPRPLLRLISLPGLAWQQLQGLGLVQGRSNVVQKWAKFDPVSVSARFAELLAGWRIQSGRPSTVQLQIILGRTARILGTDRFSISLDRAEKEVARSHLDLLFSNPSLIAVLLKNPLGEAEDDLQSREKILEKIEREGLEGYVQFLIASLNQRWSPVYIFESLPAQKRDFLRTSPLKDDHIEGAISLVELIDLIEGDFLIGPLFRARWAEFSRRFSLDFVRQTAFSVLEIDSQE